jgi:hypothetical protein
MMPRLPSFAEAIPDFRTLQSVALLALCVEDTEVNNIWVSRPLCCSIDMNGILLHLKFDSRLSIPVTRNKSKRLQKIGVQSRKVFEKFEHFQTPPPQQKQSGNKKATDHFNSELRQQKGNRSFQL